MKLCKHPCVWTISLCNSAICQNLSLCAVQKHRWGVLHPDDCGGGIRGADEDLPGPPRQPPGPRGSQERLQTDGDQDRSARERGDSTLHAYIPFSIFLGISSTLFSVFVISERWVTALLASYSRLKQGKSKRGNYVFRKKDVIHLLFVLCRLPFLYRYLLVTDNNSRKRKKT